MLEKLGIKMVTLDLPYRLNHVNCLLAEGKKGWVIIDTGLHDSKTRSVWKTLLENKEMSDLIISHYHPDHFGYAGALQQITNAKVYMTEIDKISGAEIWEPSFVDKLKKNYIKSGVPHQEAKKMTKNIDNFRKTMMPYPTVNHHLEEGSEITFGDQAYEVISTPGHSDGLVVFYNKENNTLLSTDHILPNITPNIAYWFRGIKNPLQAYFNSLMKIKKLDVGFVIPSHGKPFYNANKRIEAIIAHHDERLNEILDTLVNGETAHSISEKLFNFDLDIHERRFALGETIAHLEYLRSKGELCQTSNKGITVFLKD